jgi:hypothetical protein
MGQGLVSESNRSRERSIRLVLSASLLAALVATGLWAGAAIEASFRGLVHSMFRSRSEAMLSAREAMLLRQNQGLDELIGRAERGPLLDLSGDHAVVIVDQELVESLLGALVPAEHLIAGRYRVHVAKATVAFEDGFGLVRLDGRASLAGAEAEVFADLTVFGDLEVLRTQPTSEVLEARIHVVAVEARRVDMLVEARQAQDLVEELGKTKLEEFAVLASSLQIPVRQEHAFQVPALGPRGPVQIEAASVPFRMTVLDVMAFHGKLFISMVAGTGAPPRALVASPPAPAAARDRVDQATRVIDLEREHRERHVRFEALVESDPFLREAVRVEADLALALRADFARDVIREVARGYLDRVDLKLSEIDVLRQGSLRKDTFLGRIRAGDWTIGLRIHEIKGVLRAGEPDVRFLEGNRVAVTFPAHLEQGEGRASLVFKWDSRGIAKLVCRDFTITEEIHGAVVPEEYPVHGDFTLVAADGALTAQPSFTSEFRIKLDLSPGSWAAVRARLEEQDRFVKCGMALDPEKVMLQLRELVGNGFNVKVPARIFRTIVLPADLAESVTVARHEVGVAITGSALQVSRDMLWYSATVGLRLPAALRGQMASSGPIPLPTPGALLHAATAEVLANRVAGAPQD